MYVAGVETGTLRFTWDHDPFELYELEALAMEEQLDQGILNRELEFGVKANAPGDAVDDVRRI